MQSFIRHTLIIAFAGIHCLTFGQRSPKAPTDTTTNNLREEEVGIMVEIPAEYPGGPAEFDKYIKRNLKYPKKAAKQGLTGKVYIELIVNEDGSINDNTVKPVKRERLAKADRPLYDSECQREAMRLLKECPKWIPASRNGKPEKQAMVIAIPFQL